jgi:regulator of RNase E activity RraA
VVDGAIRDVEEMCYAGFKALASRLCVGHGHSGPIRWGCPVEVFGQRIEPGQLIHADRHGFLAVPCGDEAGLLEAARFMDANECATLISAARSGAELDPATKLDRIDAAGAEFGRRARERFGREGEW